ncbi:Oligopeptide-binding protein OppA [Geodia barretti]|uniref:Oligopeptide-binding protein OppA n=1 Tax=Geodia barretti TaxID=519541 RepID=A0AA35WNI0_GEOBA|nr:Oligopeptide-binding protein OppA [Geodia barretti]
MEGTMIKDRKYYLLLALGAVFVLALAVACGSQPAAEPQVIEKIVEVEKVVEKEVQVPVEVVKEVVVEKIVEVEKVVTRMDREVVIATPSPAESHFYMAATSPNAKRGGIARIHQHGPAGSYDIFSSTSNTRQNWMSLVYDQLLVKSARDPSSEVVPDLAHTWEVSDDFIDIHFLPPGGSEVPQRFRPNLRGCKGHTPNDYTLVVTIPESDVKPLQWTMTGWSSQYLKIADDAELAKYNGRFHEVSPVDSSGSGPYIMTEINDDRVRTEANPTTGTQMLLIWMGLTSSGVDWSMFITPVDSNDPDGPLATHPGLNHGYHTIPDAAGIGLNNVTGPLSDPRVRKAIAIGLDVEQVRKVLSPYFQAEYHGGFWPYSPELGNFSLTKPQLDEMKYFRSPTPEDLAEARQLLAEAGYASGADVPTLTIITMEDPGFLSAVQAYQAMLKENLDIESQIEVSEMGIYHQKYHDREYDIGAEMYFPMHNPYPEEWLQYTLGYVDGKPGGMNRSGANMPGFDDLLLELGNTKTMEERMEVSKRLFDLLLDEMPHLPMTMGYVNHEWWSKDFKGYRCDECSYTGAYMGGKWDYVWLDR